MLFGGVTLARVKDSADLRRLIPDYILDSKTLIVKPNWFSCHPGNFTDAVLCGLIRVDPEKVGFLMKGEEEFGPYDRALVEKARAVSSDWFPVD